MTAGNFDAALRELQGITPFRIFTVELNGGRRFEVDAPSVLVVREGLAVFSSPGGVPVLFDHDSVNHIIVGPARTKL